MARNFLLGSGRLAAAVMASAVALSAGAADVAVPAEGESPAIDRIRAAGEFRGGTAIGAPGLLQDPATGELIGPAMIIGAAIAEHLGVEFVPVESNWDVIIAGLQSNRYEVAIAPLLTTPKRLKVVDIIPYYNDGLCYAVRKDNEKMSDITTKEQLNDPSVNWSTVTGSAAEEWIRKHFGNANLRSVQPAAGAGAAIQEVVSGRADVVSQNSSQVQVTLARFPELRFIPPKDECLKNPDSQVPVGMAVLKGDAALVEFMNAVVASLETEIDEAIAKYTSPEFMIRK